MKRSEWGEETSGRSPFPSAARSPAGPSLRGPASQVPARSERAPGTAAESSHWRGFPGREASTREGGGGAHAGAAAEPASSPPPGASRQRVPWASCALTLGLLCPGQGDARPSQAPCLDAAPWEAARRGADGRRPWGLFPALRLARLGVGATAPAGGALLSSRMRCCVFPELRTLKGSK